MRLLGILVLLLLLEACDGPDPIPSREDVIAGSLASSVQLFAEREGGARRAGSGVVLAVEPEGRALILTAGHLLDPAAEQAVFVNMPGRDGKVEAQLLALNTDLDVAILQVTDLRAVPVRLKPHARLGDKVWVVSFPWGRRGTLVTGVVSQIADRNTQSLLPVEGPVGLIDAAVSYGTSGGGVFDGRTGRLIGIVRGYRTARLSLPGSDAGSLEFPIAGETTVIPTAELLCMLQSSDLPGWSRAAHADWDIDASLCGKA
jgi:S1-C subfamily serine protease